MSINALTCIVVLALSFYNTYSIDVIVGGSDLCIGTCSLTAALAGTNTFDNDINLIEIGLYEITSDVILRRKISINTTVLGSKISLNGKTILTTYDLTINTNIEMNLGSIIMKEESVIPNLNINNYMNNMTILVNSSKININGATLTSSNLNIKESIANILTSSFLNSREIVFESCTDIMITSSRFESSLLPLTINQKYNLGLDVMISNSNFVSDSFESILYLQETPSTVKIDIIDTFFLDNSHPNHAVNNFKCYDNFTEIYYSESTFNNNTGSSIKMTGCKASFSGNMSFVSNSYPVNYGIDGDILFEDTSVVIQDPMHFPATYISGGSLLANGDIRFDGLNIGYEFSTIEAGNIYVSGKSLWQKAYIKARSSATSLLIYLENTSLDICCSNSYGEFSIDGTLNIDVNSKVTYESKEGKITSLKNNGYFEIPRKDFQLSLEGDFYNNKEFSFGYLKLNGNLYQSNTGRTYIKPHESVSDLSSLLVLNNYSCNLVGKLGLDLDSITGSNRLKYNLIEGCDPGVNFDFLENEFVKFILLPFEADVLTVKIEEFLPLKFSLDEHYTEAFMVFPFELNVEEGIIDCEDLSVDLSNFQCEFISPTKMIIKGYEIYKLLSTGIKLNVTIIGRESEVAHASDTPVPMYLPDCTINPVVNSYKTCNSTSVTIDMRSTYGTSVPSFNYSIGAVTSTSPVFDIDFTSDKETIYLTNDEFSIDKEFIIPVSNLTGFVEGSLIRHIYSGESILLQATVTSCDNITFGWESEDIDLSPYGASSDSLYIPDGVLILPGSYVFTFFMDDDEINKINVTVHVDQREYLKVSTKTHFYDEDIVINAKKYPEGGDEIYTWKVIRCPGHFYDEGSLINGIKKNGEIIPSSQCGRDSSPFYINTRLFNENLIIAKNTIAEGEYLLELIVDYDSKQLSRYVYFKYSRTSVNNLSVSIKQNDLPVLSYQKNVIRGVVNDLEDPFIDPSYSLEWIVPITIDPSFILSPLINSSTLILKPYAMSPSKSYDFKFIVKHNLTVAEANTTIVLTSAPVGGDLIIENVEFNVYKFHAVHWSGDHGPFKYYFAFIDQYGYEHFVSDVTNVPFLDFAVLSFDVSPQNFTGKVIIENSLQQQIVFTKTFLYNGLNLTQLPIQTLLDKVNENKKVHRRFIQTVNAILHYLTHSRVDNYDLLLKRVSESDAIQRMSFIKPSRYNIAQIISFLHGLSNFKEVNLFKEVVANRMKYVMDNGVKNMFSNVNSLSQIVCYRAVDAITNILPHLSIENRTLIADRLKDLKQKIGANLEVNEEYGIKSSNIKMSISRFSRRSMDQKDFNITETSSGSNFVIPKGIIKRLEEEDLVSTMTEWIDVFPYWNNSGTVRVVSLEIRDRYGGDIKLNDSLERIQITIPTTNGSESLQGVWFDLGNKVWRTDGCNDVTVKNGSVTFYCNHLTDFSSVYKLKDESGSKLPLIIGLTVMAIVIVAVVIIILLAVFNRRFRQCVMPFSRKGRERI